MSCRLLIVIGDKFILSKASITFSMFLQSMDFWARYSDFFSGINASNLNIFLLIVLSFTFL